jgi:hypothetical protein
MLQEAATALVVLGAVVFLVRRLFGRAPEKPSSTFIPIGQLKKKPDDHCR